MIPWNQLKRRFMDIKTIFLYAAFAIVSFNLWTEWNHSHPIEKTEQAVKVAEPVVHTQSNAALDPTIKPISDQFVTVKTDVLNLKIDLQNGDLVYASLLKFPNSLKSDAQPFTLFQQDIQQQYYAVSNFIEMKGNQPENIKIQYTSPQVNYALAENQNDLAVTFQGINSSGLKVEKVYHFKRGSYIIQVSYAIQNLTPQIFKTYLNQQLVWQNPLVPESSMFQIGSFTGASFGQPGKHRYKKVSFDNMKKENLDVDSQGGWVAMQQHYFLTAWIPHQKGLNRLYTQANQDKYTIGSVSEPYTLKPQQLLTLNNQLYVGPEDTAVLKTLAPGLDLTVDYGWLWFLSDAIFTAMRAIDKVIGNWGWSIVMITVLIKLLFYRLSASSYRSMANMRRLQPKLEQLKQRFGDDKAKFSQATMELYKQEKVNPLGGCLPIVIQIPVFIGLYWVLVESVELRHAPFMFWIQDLSAADPFHVLPLIMGLTMLIQQKLNPAPPDPTQAKVMMLMPIFFTILFWGFPSGLVLYWIVNNTLSILQQWWITRQYKNISVAK